MKSWYRRRRRRSQWRRWCWTRRSCTKSWVTGNTFSYLSRSNRYIVIADEPYPILHRMKMSFSLFLFSTTELFKFCCECILCLKLYLKKNVFNYLFLHCLPVFPPECLSVCDGEAAVSQLAQTLQACVALKDPVQQVKLIKKVGLVASVNFRAKNVCFSPMVTSHSVSLLQAGSQLRCLGEEQKGGALNLLGSCLHTLGLLYVSLTPKNPLRSAIARSILLCLLPYCMCCVFFST